MREHRVPLNAGETLRVTLEVTPSGRPVVRFGLVVRRAGGGDVLTPQFTLAVGDVGRVAAALAAFADRIAREAETLLIREHGQTGPHA